MSSVTVGMALVAIFCTPFGWLGGLIFGLIICKIIRTYKGADKQGCCKKTIPEKPESKE